MIDAFAESQGISMDIIFCKASFGKCLVRDVPIFLSKPQTYMNLSGESVICDAYTPAAKIFSHPDVIAEEPWYGIEHEYTLLQKDVKWPIRWPSVQAQVPVPALAPSPVPSKDLEELFL